MGMNHEPTYKRCAYYHPSLGVRKPTQTNIMALYKIVNYLWCVTYMSIFTNNQLQSGCIHRILHSQLRSITHVATKLHVIVRSFCSVTMDAWYYRFSVACGTMELEFILLSPPLLWSTPLGLPMRCGICMHQHSVSGIRRRRRRRRWHSTCWHMMQCEGVRWLLWWLALITNILWYKEINVIIKSEIWATNICSVGFRNIRKCVILWRLILQILGCSRYKDHFNKVGLQVKTQKPDPHSCSRRGFHTFKVDEICSGPTR